MNRIRLSYVFNRKNCVNSKGVAPITLRAYHKGKTRYLSTGIMVSENQWDRRNSTVHRNHPQHVELNLQLDNQIHKIEKLIFQRQANGKVIGLDLLEDLDSRLEKFKVCEFIRDQIEKQNVGKTTKASYRNTLSHIESFLRRDIYFDQINYELFQAFEGYLHKKGKAQNTIHKNFKNFRKFLHLAKRMEQWCPEDPMFGYKVKYQKGTKQTITESELKRLEEKRFRRYESNLEAARDMFLFGCYTGLRISDVVRLRKNNLDIQDDTYTLSFIAFKTGKEGDPQPYLKFGMTIGTQGLRFFSSLDLNVPFGNFSAGYGFSATYHSNFYSTNKSGFEFRNSLQLNFNDGSHNVSIGTNMWGGTGQMKEFSQRTGMCSYSYKGFGFSYENDGVPFGSIGLGDNNDSYRTAAASIFGGGVSLNMNLLTGRRDASSFAAEYDLPGGKMGIPEGLGQFGEFYSHGFVVESGNKYRFGGLTLNYNGFSIGIDSDRYVRHAFQNVFAHDIIKDQRMFPVLSGGMNPVINYTPLKLNYSNFTTWGL